MKETHGAVTRGTLRTAEKAGRTRQRRGPGGDLGEGASAEAKRLAAAILEVLAGVRTPTQAAQALGMSLPRYYLLEVRALQGMLVACEPRSMGPQPSSESALAALRSECERLRRDCARQQALVRAAQRTIGLAAPAPAPSKPAVNGKKRRRRRPTARALRVAARLQEEVVAPVVMTTPAAGV